MKEQNQIEATFLNVLVGLSVPRMDSDCRYVYNSHRKYMFRKYNDRVWSLLDEEKKLPARRFEVQNVFHSIWKLSIPKTYALHLYLFWFLVFTSHKTGTWSVQIWWRWWSHGDQAERQILHPQTWSHRELHVHVEADSWPQIQRVGMGGCSGQTFTLILTL